MHARPCQLNEGSTRSGLGPATSRLKWGAPRVRFPVTPAHGGLAMLKAGDAAPAFSAKDHLGNEVSLAALRGKTVVLWFFPKADTPG